MSSVATSTGKIRVQDDLPLRADSEPRDGLELALDESELLRATEGGRSKDGVYRQPLAQLRRLRIYLSERLDIRALMNYLSSAADESSGIERLRRSLRPNMFTSLISRQDPSFWTKQISRLPNRETPISRESGTSGRIFSVVTYYDFDLNSAVRSRILSGIGSPRSDDTDTDKKEWLGVMPALRSNLLFLPAEQHKDKRRMNGGDAGFHDRHRCQSGGWPGNSRMDNALTATSQDFVTDSSDRTKKLPTLAHATTILQHTAKDSSHSFPFSPTIPFEALSASADHVANDD
ncbi:hypothetical protein R3P38DRAFT_2768229 [Favolaschia claudopus]|uniref:Uncharacterized protein n=1 Tax=Favolaschia claudopus TaxID=2862362 RepID=A0AAW0CVZ5_9AGAR